MPTPPRPPALAHGTSAFLWAICRSASSSSSGCSRSRCRKGTSIVVSIVSRVRHLLRRSALRANRGAAGRSLRCRCAEHRLRRCPRPVDRAALRPDRPRGPAQRAEERRVSSPPSAASRRSLALRRPPPVRRSSLAQWSRRSPLSRGPPGSKTLVTDCLGHHGAIDAQRRCRLGDLPGASEPLGELSRRRLAAKSSDGELVGQRGIQPSSPLPKTCSTTSTSRSE